MMMWDEKTSESQSSSSLDRLKQLSTGLTAKEKIDGIATKIETEVHEKAQQQRRLRAGEGRAQITEICERLVGEILNGIDKAEREGDTGVRIGRAVLEYAFAVPESQPPETRLEKSEWDVLDLAAVQVRWKSVDGVEKSKRTMLIYSDGGRFGDLRLWEMRYCENLMVDLDSIPRLGPKPWFPKVSEIDCMLSGTGADLPFLKDSSPQQIDSPKKFCDWWWGLFCDAISA